MPEKLSPKIVIALLLLLSVQAFLLIGDYDVRLANMLADDGPVLYSRILNGLDTFDRDMIGVNAKQLALTSAMHLIPIALQRYAAVPPEISAWVITYLQTVLTGLAVFCFARAATGRNDVGAIAMAFALTATPWRWNLANFGSIMFVPYAGHLALPFLIFSATALLRDRVVAAAIYLGVASLIHPLLTLYMIAITGLFWLWRDRAESAKLLARLAVLAAIAALCVLPGLWVLGQGGGSVPDSHMLPVLRQNMHMVPWNYPGVWDEVMPAFFSLVVMAMLGFRFKDKLISAFPAFWVTSMVAVCVLSLLHLVGLRYDIIPLIQALPLRASVLAAMFCLPLLTLYVVEHAENDSSVVFRWTGLALLVLLALYGWPPIGVLALILILSDLSQNRLGPMHLSLKDTSARWLTVLGLLLFGFWLAANVDRVRGGGLIGAWLPAQLQAALLPPIFRAHVVGLAAIGLVFFLIVVGNWHRFLTLLTGWVPASAAKVGGVGEMWRPSTNKALVAGMSAVMLFSAWTTGRETQYPRAVALYDAQVWARKNTLASAVFIIYEIPWRTVSLRAAVEPVTQGFYIYSRNSDIKAFDDRYQAFYGLQQVAPSMTVVQLQAAERKAYLSLDESGIRDLAARFGGDYLVRSKSEPPMRFPVAYQNSEFVIYSLAPPG